MPATDENVDFVEGRSNIWKAPDSSDLSAERCRLSKLLPRPSLAECIEVELLEDSANAAASEILSDNCKLNQVMRATLVHKPIGPGWCFHTLLKGLSFRVSAVVPPHSELVLVAPKTLFTLKQKASNPIDCSSIQPPAGLEAPFAQIRDLLDPLALEKMRSLGLQLPRGILLSGPPGVGKTFLVGYIAKHYDLPLVVVNGPELISPVPGESESNLLRVFEEAKREASKSAAKCALLFFDEVDSIAKTRDPHESTASELRILIQLLTLLDGFDSKAKIPAEHVIFVAATNLPDSLDPALRRPGRFDREVVFETPDSLARTQILQGICKEANVQVAQDTDWSKLGASTNGYVSADLASLVQETVQISAQPSTKEFLEAMKRVGPSLHRLYQIKRDPTITWDSIAGIDPIRDELKRAVEWPLIHQETYERLGLIPPKGVLLYGPPGCSKTTLVQAMANSGGFTFFSLNGASVFSCYLGESERQIRQVFHCARMTAPSLIFIDEIDKLVGKRSSGTASDDPIQDRVLSTLLNEMDGINGSSSKRIVMVVAATNRPDFIDEALMRPGRFDRHIEIPLPDKAGRVEILRLFVEKCDCEADVDVESLAERCVNYSGAELKNLVQEAAMLAIHDGSNALSMDHLNCALKGST
jgi:transitional endoplasmic reticulum ATPase